MNLASILSFLSAQAEQIPTPQIPVSEVSTQSFWKGLEGLSFDELIQKMVNGLISFGLKVAIAVLVFYVGRYIIRKLYKMVYNVMTHRHIDQSLTTFVLSLIRMVLYFILVISIIGILGLETSSFLAIFASAGVAIGMALSGTLQNFAGGVLILLLKPYKVGDFIEVNGFTGTVKSIQLFNTVINTVDNKAIILPNGALSTGSINNYSLESYRRVDWTVCLAYGTDLDKAKEYLDKSGVNTDGLKLTVTYMNGFDEYASALQLYQVNLKQLGISLELRSMEWDQQWAQAQNTDPKDRQDMFVFIWWPDYADPVSWFQSLLHSEDQIVYNLSYLNDPELDAVIDDAIEKTVTDRAAAEADYVQAQKIVADNAYILNLYDQLHTFVINNGIQGVSENPSYSNAILYYNVTTK